MQQMSVMMFETMGHLSPYQMFLLGRLDAAHSNRAFMQDVEKKVRSSSEQETASASKGLWSEEDHAYYDGVKRTCAVAVDEASSRRQEAEKFYTKCRHELIESGVSQDLVQQYVNQLGKEQAEAKKP